MEGLIIKQFSKNTVNYILTNSNYTTMSIIVTFYNEEKCLEIFTIIFLKTLK